MALNPSFAGRVYPPSPPYLVTREKICEFVTAIGDANPAFYDGDAARALGYRDVVAPPTFAIALTLPAGSQVTTDPDLGLDYTKVVHGEQHFRHHRPLVAGDEVTVTVTVHSIRQLAGNDILEFRADISALDGELITEATTVLVARGTASVT